MSSCVFSCVFLGFRDVISISVPFIFLPCCLVSGLVSNLKLSFMWILRHQCLEAKCQAAGEPGKPSHMRLFPHLGGPWGRGIAFKYLQSNGSEAWPWVRPPPCLGFCRGLGDGNNLAFEHCLTSCFLATPNCSVEYFVALLIYT